MLIAPLPRSKIEIIKRALRAMHNAKMTVGQLTPVCANLLSEVSRRPTGMGESSMQKGIGAAACSQIIPEHKELHVMVVMNAPDPSSSCKSLLGNIMVCGF